MSRSKETRKEYYIIRMPVSIDPSILDGAEIDISDGGSAHINKDQLSLICQCKTYKENNSKMVRMTVEDGVPTIESGSCDIKGQINLYTKCTSEQYLPLKTLPKRQLIEPIEEIVKKRKKKSFINKF